MSSSSENSDRQRSATTADGTDCVHGGDQRQWCHGSIVDPIFPSTTYAFDSTDALVGHVTGEAPLTEYSRCGHPGEVHLERRLAALDDAPAAVLYGSGMAAVVGAIMAQVSSGDEILFFDEAYHHSREFCTEYLTKFGVRTHLVETGDYDALESAINDRTRLMICESPTNPHMTVVDLQRYADIGRRNNVTTMVDSTLATPINQRPFQFGVDYVVHSATKYLGGHNDLLAGVVLGSNEAIEPVRKLRTVMGGTIGAHTVYLLSRGLKTLEVRVQRQNANAQAVAEFLHNHPRVDRAYYPGLRDHPTHAIAKQQMRGFGGLLMFSVKDADWKRASAVLDHLKLFRIAASLGGCESLAEQPKVFSHFSKTPEQLAAIGFKENMIRISCGIENAEDLIADLDQALKRSA